MLIWTGVALAVAVVTVILGWHGGDGNPDPTDPSVQLSPTAVVLNSAVLVFREGLECILVLAAVTASFLGRNRSYRKPVAYGGAVGIAASVATWFIVVWAIDTFGGDGLGVQAATGIPAIIVLLVVMNWFFHNVYWTGWISHHNKRRKSVVSAARDEQTALRATVLGLALLGFTSVYREGFEIVIFLQGLRERYGSSTVLEGLTLGLLFTAAVGVLTFVLHERLPYKKLLVITGGLLVVVLWVMVGEEINEMQLAGWIGTTPIPGVDIPGWAGQWFSVFGNWETLIAQVVALVLVVGSYVGAQYLRVWRPRRRGERAARMSAEPPSSTELPAGAVSEAAQ
ncbi:FTR1 family protein [Actinomycetospora endophytica]|uniref:FTR1 family protein n=1 Tax=Actinomycetospora endophytica TaxID=2291215 RepID=A0ABS8P1C9_9PSEU|nr:FTR1 family protein [Actinomycetospora endophytica]MCD2192055.1 FTR1 family protein [Actinomycetospora endophytica]